MFAVHTCVRISLLALLFAWQPVLPQPRLNDMTPAGFVREMGGIVRQMEQSASSLMAQGNGEMAQQQLLMADLLKQVIQQVSTAYVDSMNKTFAQLNVTETNTFRDIRELAKRLTNVQGKLTKDVQATIYKSQEVANQLLDRLPFSHPTPVYYGMTARDLLSDREESAVDIEILGFLMSDQRLGYKQPVVRVKESVLPRASVAVQRDRVNVTLPNLVRQSVGFAGGACQPRESFPVSIEVFYAVPTPWYIAWRKYDEKSVIFNANAWPGVQTFEVTLQARKTRTVTTLRTVPFNNASDTINVACEQGLPGSATQVIPPGASVTCKGEWGDISNLSSHEAGTCTPTPNGRTVTGTIRGLDKDFFGNCPGGGHADLHIVGSYVVTDVSTVPADDPLSARVAMRGRTLSHTLQTQQDVTLNSVNAQIFRTGCPRLYDQLSIQVPTIPAAEVETTSTNGLFKASLRGHQFEIEAR
jgi:hypothetical protein